MILPLLTFAASFSVAVFCAVYFLPEAFLVPAAVVLLAAGIVAALLLRSKRPHVLIITFGVVLGLLWVWGYTALLLSPVEPLHGAKIDAVLQLEEYPQRSDYGAKCTVRMEGYSGSMIYYGDASLMDLAPGDTLYGTVSCYSARSVQGTDSTRYLSQKIILRLYPVGKMEVVRSDGFHLRYLPQELVHRLTCSVISLYSEETRGFILALLTGERSSMNEQTSTNLEEAGLIHITAVSGLHCGFLIAALTLLVGGNRFVRAAVCYPVLTLYMLMVGATPSVVRACVMSGLMLASFLLEREDDPPTSLGAAALVILLGNPYAIASVSFQLSFASVAGLLCISPRIYQFLRSVFWPERRTAKRLWSALAAGISTSFGALVFTAPVSAYYFGAVSLISPLSNLLVMPVVQVLFAVALLLTAVHTVFSGIGILAFVVEIPARYILWVAEFCSDIPVHSVSLTGAAVLMWFVLVYAMLLVCLVSKDPPGKYALAAVLAILSLAVVYIVPAAQVKDDALTVVCVDVGQGAATLLHSGEVTVLVDCGTDYHRRGSGACVTDTMTLYGWDRLDYVVLTHYHEDHAGGLDELLARTHVGTLLLPRASSLDEQLHDEVEELAKRYGVALQYVDKLQRVLFGETCLTLYPPLTRGQTNEEGLTLLCSTGKFDLLITGDMNMSTERLLVDRYAIPDIEVLLVGHHGSASSTSQELLTEVSPEVGIISVGDNRYGHPTEETLNRLSWNGCRIYRTDTQGNILIQVR